MYNDYYLISIDNKLDNLQTLITNQETLISNQNTLIESFEIYKTEFSIFTFWVIALFFAIIFYHFYHTCYNKFR